MKKINIFLPYSAGLMLLVLIIGIDIAAVKLFFGDVTQAALIGVFLSLESLFFLFHGQLGSMSRCSGMALKRWVRHFYRMFLAMGACSTAAFAISTGGLPSDFMELLMDLLKLIFWLLAIVLLMIGAGMALCVVGVHDSDDDSNDGMPPPDAVYGRAGYGYKNNL